MLHVTQLSGFGGGGKPTALSFIADAAGGATGAGSVSVTIPATAAAGDLALWFHHGYAASGAAIVPADFTPLATWGISSTGLMSAIGYKVLASGDAGASKTGGSASGGTSPARSGVVVVLRPDAPINSVVLGMDFNDEDTAGNPAAQAVNLSGSANLNIAVAMYHAAAAITPRTSTPAMNERQGGITRHYIKWDTQNVDYSMDMNDEGVNRLQSGFLVVT